MNSLIRWFHGHRTAANLLCLAIVLAGLLAFSNTRQELVPNLSLNRIAVLVAYPGADPEVVEKTLCRRIEHAIIDMPGLREVSPVSEQGRCRVTASVRQNVKVDSVLNKVAARVEGIRDLPSNIEKPIIRELVERNRVARLIISGPLSSATLKNLAQNIRSQLLALDDISTVDLANVQPDEISIEVSPSQLRRYDISLNELAQAIRKNSLDFPSGSVQTASGDVLVSGLGKAETTRDYQSLIVRAEQNGSQLQLKDIAEIIEGGAANGAVLAGSGENGTEGTLARFNGQPAVALDIYRVADENIVATSTALKRFVKHARLPGQVTLHIWQDNAEHFVNRSSMLLKNGLTGLVLLFIILMLFLNNRLALWVSLGIPVAFLGAFTLLPLLDQSLSFISLFAFILVMGIVVDDAIIVGESVYTRQARGLPLKQAALQGTQAVAKPVLFSVGTSIIVFVPMLFLPGVEGNLIRAIPIVVVATLLFSLLECFLILPSHLAAGSAPAKKRLTRWARCQARFSRGMEQVIHGIYKPLLFHVMRRKYLVISLFVAIFFMHVGLLHGGWISVSLFTRIASEVATANVAFAEGSPRQLTTQALQQLEKAANEVAAELREEHGRELIQHIYTTLGTQRRLGESSEQGSRHHSGQVFMQFTNGGNKLISGDEIIALWRVKGGDIAGAEQLQFNADLFPPRPDISIEIRSTQWSQLQDVVKQVKQRLANYDGVYEIRDSLSGGKQQLALTLKPVARGLGLSLEDLSAQVRQAFHGVELQRFQRGENDVKVWLRYPEKLRNSVWHLENMPIRLGDQSSVPLLAVANITYRGKIAPIAKRDRHFVAQISAYVQPQQNRASTIMQNIENNYLAPAVAASPSLHWSLGRSQQRSQELLQHLKTGYLLALLAIYVLLAIVFSSYLQPLLIMVAIPFGLLGCLMGHWLLNQPLTLWSLVGMIAASGIVVNDNLVLVNYINECREKGRELSSAIFEAGIARFRPVMLTSLCTFFGLLPLFFERGVQAQFLLPTAISLAFGVLFATLVCLVLMPAMYLAITDDHRSYGLTGSWKMFAQRVALSGKTAAQHATSFQTNFQPTQSEETPHLEQVYEAGFRQGMMANQCRCPYSDEVLVSAWEAGWEDAQQRYA